VSYAAQVRFAARLVRNRGNRPIRAPERPAFTVGCTAIFIALYSRVTDVMQQDKGAMTGAIATFKDPEYTLGRYPPGS
jgi:hypothetical protein